MVVAAFLVVDKANWVRFFEEIFLMANISPKIVFGMLFFIPSSADVDFSGQKLQLKTYTIKKTLSTTRHVKQVRKKEFAAAALDPKYETYIIHIASFSSTPLVAFLDSTPLNIYPSWRSQISGLVAEKISIKVLNKYLDFADIFFPNLASKLPEHTGINDYTIKLVNSQLPPSGPIYSLEPVELEILKAYIEINLANSFIRPSKSPASAPILFDRKSNGSFQLCVNYWGFNNLTIKNRYPLPLIEESLDKLGRARRFTQLDLTNAYHQIRIRKGDK